MGTGVGAGHRHHDVVLRRHDEARLHHGPVWPAGSASRRAPGRADYEDVDLRRSRTTSRPRGCGWRAGRRAGPCSTGRAGASPIARAKGSCGSRRLATRAHEQRTVAATAAARRPPAGARRAVQQPHAARPAADRRRGRLHDRAVVADFGPSHLATPDTYVEFEGRTAYGDASRIPFHVTQRRLAGKRSAAGRHHDGLRRAHGRDSDRRLRHVRRRDAERFPAPAHRGRASPASVMRAWDVEWGTAKGTAVIENNYVDVKDVLDHARGLRAVRRRPLLRRLPAPRRRRRAERAHPRDQPAGVRSAARVRHRRLRRVTARCPASSISTASTSEPHGFGNVSLTAAWPTDEPSTRRWPACGSKAKACASTTSS